ncbi:MAG: hypothetical protein K0U66_00905 [Gammaproteobacteria bacterium]|nr:hypothetical protein [Gammaproteobacteria bacterium]
MNNYDRDDNPLAVRLGWPEQLAHCASVGTLCICEEMDWCLRIQEAGWGVYAVPTAHVTHYEGQSSRQVRWVAYEWLWRSRFRFYQQHRKRYPAGYMFAL